MFNYEAIFIRTHLIVISKHLSANDKRKILYKHILNSTLSISINTSYKSLRGYMIVLFSLL